MKTPSFRISSAIDAFWQDPGECPETTPLKLLVLSPLLTEGSEEEKLVQNIIKACKLPEEQTRLVMATEDGAFPTWQYLKKCYAPGVVLNMGVSPQQLAINALFPTLRPILFGESYWTTVNAPAELMQDRDTRQRLWTDVLKPYFGG